MKKSIDITKSSNIKRVEYDPITSELFVEFLKGGKYKYFNVPEVVYTKFTEGGSAGKHFFSAVKGKYECSKLN